MPTLRVLPRYPSGQRGVDQRGVGLGQPSATASGHRAYPPLPRVSRQCAFHLPGCAQVQRGRGRWYLTDSRPPGIRRPRQRLPCDRSSRGMHDEYRQTGRAGHPGHPGAADGPATDSDGPLPACHAGDCRVAGGRAGGGAADTDPVPAAVRPVPTDLRPADRCGGAPAGNARRSRHLLSGQPAVRAGRSHPWSDPVPRPAGRGGVVTVPAVVRDQVSGSAFSRVMGFIMIVMATAPLVAPLLGSLILLVSGWRMIFVVLAVAAALVACLYVLKLGETLALARRTRFNLPSVTHNYLRFFRDGRAVCYMLCSALAVAGMFGFLAASPFVYIQFYGVSEPMYGVLFALNILVL